jgi:hypothetical protein
MSGRFGVFRVYGLGFSFKALHCAYYGWLSFSPTYIYYLRQHETITLTQDHQIANAFICKQLGPDVAETATKRQKTCLCASASASAYAYAYVCVCVFVCVCLCVCVC